MPFKLHDYVDSLEFLEDASISWKARGIMLALLKMPQQSATIEDLVSQSSDGVSSVRSGLQELEKHGYGYHYRNHGEGARITEGVPVNRPGYVYVVQRGDDCYKIGQATNLDLRLDKLARYGLICLIWAVKVRDVNALEGKLHSLFAHRRIDNEWFELSKADIEYIKGLGAQDV